MRRYFGVVILACVGMGFLGGCGKSLKKGSEGKVDADDGGVEGTPGDNAVADDKSTEEDSDGSSTTTVIVKNTPDDDSELGYRFDVLKKFALDPNGTTKSETINVGDYKEIIVSFDKNAGKFVCKYGTYDFKLSDIERNSYFNFVPDELFPIYSPSVRVFFRASAEVFWSAPQEISGSSTNVSTQRIRVDGNELLIGMPKLPSAYAYNSGNPPAPLVSCDGNVVNVVVVGVRD